MSKKSEIIEKLDEAGIEYDADASLAELKALLPEDGADESEDDPSEDSPAKAAYRAHIEAYAKQNPKKYELKKEALLAKLNTL